MMRTFTAIYRREGDWWAVQVLELPGAHSQGRTIEAARANIREAIPLILGVREAPASHLS